MECGSFLLYIPVALHESKEGPSDVVQLFERNKTILICSSGHMPNTK